MSAPIPGAWVSAKHPPELTIDEGGWTRSKPVRVFDGYKTFVAYAMKYEGKRKIHWISDCSEGWDITDRVKSWMPILPPTPQENKHGLVI